MDYDSYIKIIRLKRHYNFMPFHGKITDEELLDIYICENIEELEQYISKEEILFVEEWLKSGTYTSYLIEKMREGFNQMTEEEISKNLKEFFHNNTFDEEVLEAVPNGKYLLDQFEDLEYYEQRKLANYLDGEDIYKYIKNNGKAVEAVINFLSKTSDISLLIDVMETNISDFIKTRILLPNFKSSEFLQYVKDEYYRTQIVKAQTDSFTEQELNSQLKEYNIYLNNIAQFKDEKEKAEYISKIPDRDMKQSLLQIIQEKENRDIVIKSFERVVDPKIASLDQLTQKMIREFFEDALGEKFTDEKREKLEIVFKRSDVSFGELDLVTNGRADFIFRDIIISDRIQGNTNRILGCLVHEYAHLFSQFDYPYTRNKQPRTMEEGMADIFGDLVINHYLNKHKNVELDGKKVRLDNPYTVYSGYNFENAWPRTMLAGLVSSGKDLEAVGEYLLGDKLKFAEMVFGKEITEAKDFTDFGMPKIDTNREEIYHSPQLDFSNIDKNSIYYSRNHILPLFQLQNKLKDKADVVGVLTEGKSYFASYIAELYFEGKKFYEVPIEEFEEFIELLSAQIAPKGNSSAIFEILKYKNDEINNLTEEEIKNYSFEILDSIPILWSREENIKAGTSLGNVIKLALKEEERKIEEGQPIEVTRQKREKILTKYKDMFNSKNDENVYINDYIKDFDFACEQAELESENNTQTLLDIETIKDIAREDDVLKKKVSAMEKIAALEGTHEKNNIQEQK